MPANSDYIADLERRLTKARSTLARAESDVTVARTAVARLEERLEHARSVDVKEGDEVEFLFGRGENARPMRGTVAGSAMTSQGRIVAISVKDDLGLPEIKRVNIKFIKRNLDRSAAETAH